MNVFQFTTPLLVVTKGPESAFSGSAFLSMIQSSFLMITIEIEEG